MIANDMSASQTLKELLQSATHLHNQLWPLRAHASDPDASLASAICGPDSWLATCALSTQTGYQT